MGQRHPGTATSLAGRSAADCSEIGGIGEGLEKGFDPLSKDGSSSVIATYGYDPMSRRIWKEVSDVRTWYHYADEGLVGEYSNSGTQQVAYGYQPDSTWGTNPQFMKTAAGYAYYQNDVLGTPQQLVTSTGEVKWKATYDAFGEATVAAESTVTNNLRFPGQYYDGETGLHYNYFRYYEPKVGRYVTFDPIGLNDGLNSYLYVRGNPFKYIDPTGQYLQFVVPIVTGVVGAVSAATEPLNNPAATGGDVFRAAVVGFFIGATLSKVPIHGPLSHAFIKNALAGFLGNSVGQFLTNDKCSSYSPTKALAQALVAGVSGGIGNFAGYSTGLMLTVTRISAKSGIEATKAVGTISAASAGFYINGTLPSVLGGFR